MADRKHDTVESNRKNGRPPLAPHLELFCKAVAKGHSHGEAAEACGRSRGSASFLYKQPGVRERIAELQAMVAEANEKEVVEYVQRKPRRIDVGRNDIILGISELARTARSERVRLAAWSKLGEFFMLFPKQTKDVEEFYGWTDDELQYFAKTGKVPARIESCYGPLFDEPGEPAPTKEPIAAKGVKGRGGLSQVSVPTQAIGASTGPPIAGRTSGGGWDESEPPSF